MGHIYTVCVRACLRGFYVDVENVPLLLNIATCLLGGGCEVGCL